MTILQLPLQLLSVMGILAFVLSAFYLFCLVRILNARAKRSILIGNVMFLMISIAVTYSFESAARSDISNRDLDFVARKLCRLPAWLVFAVVTVVLICAIVYGINLNKHIKQTLSPASIQEGLDHMPDGICFSTEEGVPILVNKKMQSISTKAFDKGVLNTEHLRSFIESGSGLKNGCYARSQGASLFLYMPDLSVLNVHKNKLHFDEYTINEYIAYDNTEQYTKRKELEMRNAHLTVVNEKIREYSQNLDSILRDREILDAKIRIHDDVGRSLIALRHYLTQDNGDRDSLVELWKFTISVLKRESVSNDTNDRMDELIKAAQAVGVTLRFDGEIYMDHELEDVIAVAIHEGLTNTVRHADGSELVIKTREENGAVSVELTNNGKPPESPIEEKGGLKALRRRVEMVGGTMDIEYEPQFLFRIKLKKEQVSHE